MTFDMDEFKAKKIEHDSARIPDPTPALIAAMTDVCYMTFAVHMTKLLETRMPHVREITDEYRDAWEDVSRAAYMIVAIAGGAKLRPIE